LGVPEVIQVKLITEVLLPGKWQLSVSLVARPFAGIAFSTAFAVTAFAATVPRTRPGCRGSSGGWPFHSSSWLEDRALALGVLVPAIVSLHRPLHCRPRGLWPCAGLTVGLAASWSAEGIYSGVAITSVAVAFAAAFAASIISACVSGWASIISAVARSAAAAAVVAASAFVAGVASTII